MDKQDNVIFFIPLFGILLGLMFVFSGFVSFDQSDCNWNLSGKWVIAHEYNNQHFYHAMEITTQEDGTLYGTGGWPSEGEKVHSWQTLEIKTNDNNFAIVAEYDSSGEYAQLEMFGIINEDGTLVGNWQDNYQYMYRSGLLTTVDGTAHKRAKVCMQV